MGSTINPEYAEFAVARLLHPSDDWRSLVRDMAKRWPDADPLDHVLALIEAAAAIGHGHATRIHGHAGAMNGYRLAALLALDLHIMARLGMRSSAASEVVACWQSDAFLLRH
ncbi:MAG: hypothetical protein K0B00_13130 [Rhodobacteraceae bacterium]|nr:hypothetical protein [Paracoccaceae bacterium]